MAIRDRFRRALSRSDARSTPSSISTASTSTPSPSAHDLSAASTNTNTHGAGAAASPLRPTFARSTTTPAPMPALTLTKTSSRLSRILTGGVGGSSSGRDKKREKEERKLEEWARQDEKEWEAPSRKFPGKKSSVHQETLRAFDWTWRGSMDRRRSSAFSGVSPSGSRHASVDEGALPAISRVLSGGSARRKSSHGLSDRSGSRGGDGHGPGHGAPVTTVVEE